jgi:anti-sigma factor ChrR (cupin superfamily)
MNHQAGDETMEEMAALYALGALSQHEARAFEDHLAAGCSACQELVRDFADVTAALALGAPAATPPAATRATLLARLAEETGATYAASFAHSSSPPGTLTIRNGEGEWLETDTGVFIKRLFADPAKGTVTLLVRMAPGARFPTHRHTGVEECYVLEGDLHTSNHSLGPGDYHCALAGSIHDPIFTTGGSLLLLIQPSHYEVISDGR